MGQIHPGTAFNLLLHPGVTLGDRECCAGSWRDPGAASVLRAVRAAPAPGHPLLTSLVPLSSVSLVPLPCPCAPPAHLLLAPTSSESCSLFGEGTDGNSQHSLC